MSPQYPANVHFAWPETEPGGGIGCQAGLYQGSFEGTYMPGITIIGIAVAVSGNINLTLAESADGEFFVVENGVMDGVANGSVPFSGTITGRLNCPAKRLEAEIVDGVYTVGGLPYSFAGPLVADYDKTTTAMVNGVWDVVEPGGLGNLGGTGSWQATLAPDAGAP